VRDDKIIESRFWRGSFEERRCLVPATSFCEPNGDVKPASWHWFALRRRDERPIFAFPGIRRRYQGPVRKDGPKVELKVYAFLTTTPNELVATINHERMPVLLTREEEFEAWLSCAPAEALALAVSIRLGRCELCKRASRNKICSPPRREQPGNYSADGPDSRRLRRSVGPCKVPTSTWSALILLSIVSSPQEQQLRPRTRSPCLAFQRTFARL
jgi:putative SOS response-associated peptidase YedK